MRSCEAGIGDDELCRGLDGVVAAAAGCVAVVVTVGVFIGLLSFLLPQLFVSAIEDGQVALY